MNVSNEPTESEETKQAEQFDESQDFESTTGPRQLILLAALAHQQKDVVEWYRAEEVDKKPRAYVVLGDLLRLENDLVDIVILKNTL